MFAYFSRLNMTQSTTRYSSVTVRSICIFLILGIQILNKTLSISKITHIFSYLCFYGKYISQ